MSLWKRGNIYWAYVWVNGIRYHKSTGSSVRRQAELIEQHFKEELNERRFLINHPQPEMSFATLAARFLHDGDVRPYHLDRLKLLLPYFGEMPIGQISKSVVREYRKFRHRKKTISDTTINRDLEALRHILFFALDEGLLSQNPLARLKMVRERRKPRPVMSVDEEFRLLRFSAPHLRSIVIAALDTGMRRGELLNQLWEHVDFGRRLLWVSKSKTAEGESREIPLTTRLFDLLCEIREPQGLIFTFKGKPIQAIKTAWKAALRRSEIRRFRFHDLRHCCNSRLMLAGVQQEIRKAIMGHSSGEDINATYTHVELPAKREAIQKLEDWVQAEVLKITVGGNDDGSNRETASPLRIHPDRLPVGSTTSTETVAGDSGSPPQR